MSIKQTLAQLKAMGCKATYSRDWQEYRVTLPDLSPARMIRTRYQGPTDTRGSRIKATNGARQVTIPYPYELNVEDAHALAAEKLMLILMDDSGDERVEYTMARSAKDDGYCFYRVEREDA